MEEILTELSLADQRLEIPVRGDDDANVHWNWLITADALDFTFFQDAQQLSGQAHIDMAVRATKLGALDFLEKPNGQSEPRAMRLARVEFGQKLTANF